MPTARGTLLLQHVVFELAEHVAGWVVFTNDVPVQYQYVALTTKESKTNDLRTILEHRLSRLHDLRYILYVHSRQSWYCARRVV